MNTPVAPHKALTLLLYGRHAWLRRQPEGWLTLPTRQFCDASGIRRAETLRLALNALAAWGCVSNVQWHSRYFVLQVTPPLGPSAGDTLV